VKNPLEELHLIPALAEAVRDMGYTRPTPIQAEAIPVILAGRDLIGCASTGTGKTAAFLLPILQRLHAGTVHGKMRALVLSPTRELAMQIDEQALGLGYHVGLTAVSVVGGVDMRPQERALRAGADIVVATPGRLLDHMRFGYVHYSALEVLVLDEADRMLDMGFLPDIRRILRALPVERQTLMFSATMPADIRALANDILRDPVVVMVGAQRPVSGITQSVYPVAQDRKGHLLTTLLRQEAMRSVLVFVKRKREADHLARAITRSGVPATSIHSDRRQEDRIAALEAFRRGQYPVLVATDVAARGIDVEAFRMSSTSTSRSPPTTTSTVGAARRAPAPGARSSPSSRSRRRNSFVPSRRLSVRHSRAWCCRTSTTARTRTFPLRLRHPKGPAALPIGAAPVDAGAAPRRRRRSPPARSADRTPLPRCPRYTPGRAIGLS